jgi:putative ABC transport system substrate-binding protein
VPAAWAQPTIVAVKSLEVEPYNVALEGFRQTFARMARDAAIQEFVLGDRIESRERIVAQIRARRPSVMMTIGSTATAFVRGQLPDIPLVFCMVLNPVASGFVPSLRSSGGNLTGASLDIPTRVQLESFRAVVPSIKRVGVLYDPRDTGDVVMAAEKAARDLGLQLIAAPVGSSDKLREALVSLDGRIDALWAVADRTVFATDRSTEFLLKNAIEKKIPFMGLSPSFVKAGALLALGVDYRDIGAQCAEITAQVLDGHSPSDIPITAPRKTTLYVNSTVAKAIGVSIPPRILDGAVVLK